MCGIVGYTGHRDALPILIDALKRLEYRGYDSAGVAILGSGIEVHKDKGEIRHLEATLPKVKGVVGIGHTRWATHGPPSRANAHPFLDCRGRIALAHNGIIENHRRLREELEAKGHKFTSETDTEVIVHLLEEAYDGNLEEAMRRVLPRLQGSYALAVLDAQEPGKLVVARKDSPLVIGLGHEENMVASDVPAVLRETDRVVFLHDGEVAVVTPDYVRILDPEGREVKREPSRVTMTLEDAEKGGFEHFMLKEIYEQPEAVRNTLLGRLEGLEPEKLFNGYPSVKFVAMGTSYHAALAGKYILEALVGIPATAEMASEYRYSSAPYRDKPLVVLVSQSGETADTIGAAREARRRGCRTLAITNYMGSSLARECDHVVYTRAGVEIGVAATKTFAAQLTALLLLGLRLGEHFMTLTPDEARRVEQEFRAAPRAVQRVLEGAEDIATLARKYCRVKDMFYIGRHISYPLALEGALKMKEISYIHAEGYAAGELKHGPLALLGPEVPVVALVPRDATYDKVLSNIGEVSARSSPVLAIATEGDREVAKVVDDVIYIPETPPLLSVLPMVAALQLLAYHAARERGCSIDKPRHLAKSVTVE